eukprot:2576512-Rhodomonas_salina.3
MFLAIHQAHARYPSRHPENALPYVAPHLAYTLGLYSISGVAWLPSHYLLPASRCHCDTPHVSFCRMAAQLGIGALAHRDVSSIVDLKKDNHAL